MKPFFKLILFFIFSISISAALLFLSLGLLVSQHASNPEKSDVIIVLGGDNGLRVRKGAELYKAGYSSHIILTGIDERFYHPGHPNWRERRMIALGVPKKAIKVDTKSKTTWEEAENTSNTMEKKDGKVQLLSVTLPTCSGFIRHGAGHSKDLQKKLFLYRQILHGGTG